MSNNEYRFDVSEHDGTITRGRAYRLPTDWTADSWSHYMDSDSIVAFYDEGFRGSRIVEGGDEENSARALAAFQRSRDHDALDRVAERITGNPEAHFISVPLDRGVDLYYLVWAGMADADDREVRDEIEAVWNGDIWRIEIEEFQPGFGPGDSDWVPCDEYPDEFYGEDKAMAEFAKVFPLTEFPAERLVDGSE